MVRIYETIYICPTNLDEETQEEFSDTVREAIYDTGGKIIKQERWGKRRLAFNVKHHRDGVYYYVLYGSEGGTKEELERRLKLSDECLRFLTVRLDNELKGKKHKIFTEEELHLALQMESPVKAKREPAPEAVDSPAGEPTQATAPAYADEVPAESPAPDAEAPPQPAAETVVEAEPASSGQPEPEDVGKAEGEPHESASPIEGGGDREAQGERDAGGSKEEER